MNARARKPKWYVGQRVKLTAKPTNPSVRGRVGVGSEGTIVSLSVVATENARRYGKCVSVLWDGFDARGEGFKRADVSCPVRFLAPAIGPHADQFEQFMRRIVQPVGCLDAPAANKPIRVRAKGVA